MKKKTIASITVLALCFALMPSSALASPGRFAEEGCPALGFQAAAVAPAAFEPMAASSAEIPLNSKVSYVPDPVTAARLCYTFSLPSPGKVEVLFDSQTNNAPVHTFVLANAKGGTTIWTSSATSPATRSMGFYLNQGSYDISFIAQPGLSGSFRVVHKAATESFADKQEGSDNSPQTAKVVKLDSAYQGFLAQNDQTDYYKLTMTRDGKVRIKAESGAGAMYFNLLNRDYQPYLDDASSYRAVFTKDILLNKGTYYFRVSTQGNYVIPPESQRKYGSYSFSIMPMYATSAKLSKASWSYAGKAIQPKVTVKAGETTLKQDRDYVVTYADNILPGTAVATVTGKGGYSASYALRFTITGQASLSSAAVTVKGEPYTGRVQKPLPTVKLLGQVLKKGRDYTVQYSNSTKAGTAKVTIVGKGKFKGKKVASFKIAKRSLLSGTTKVIVKKAVFKGRAVKPTVLVKSAGRTLTRNRDFTVTYKNNAKVGTGKAIVKGKGSYSGSKTVTFRIVKG